MSKKIKNPTIGRPLQGEAPKSVKITVRIEEIEKDLLIKKYGSISEGINFLLKALVKKG